LVHAKVGGGCNVRAVRHFLAAGAVVLVVALLPGMGSTATGAAPAPPTSYYIALGASLVTGSGSTGGADYVNDLGTYAHQGLPGLQVVNLGCAGETSTAMIKGGRCASQYSTGTQLGDAEAFLQAHPGQVSFVTVDIGGDDVLGCAPGGIINQSCFENGLAKVEQNLPTILGGLRAAGGSVPIVGIETYDPFLELWLNGPSGQAAAQASVTLLGQFNSALASAYAQYGVTPANVAATFDSSDFALTGSWDGMSVPANVGIICNWTNMCTSGGKDVHTNNTGYAELASTFEAVLSVPLAVTLDPVDQTVTSGSTATFSAAATGLPPPAVTWQLSVDGGSTWLTVPGWTATSETTGSLGAFENGWEIRAVFTNSNGSVSTSPATITVAPPTTTVVLPSNGATLSGTPYLDATTSPGVTKVQYELSGGSLTDAVIATATPTLFGWLAAWNTTTVPNGSYTLQSVASFSSGAVTSAGVTVNINNPPPSTAVGIPVIGSTQSGTQFLDASASPGVTSVSYVLSGGPGNIVNMPISGSTPTYYGWIGGWNTTAVPNGTYTLQSVASYQGGVTGTSPGITVIVSN
jgi:lysophospholipase L1-like esterase